MGAYVVFLGNLGSDVSMGLIVTLRETSGGGMILESRAELISSYDWNPCICNESSIRISQDGWFLLSSLVTTTSLTMARITISQTGYCTAARGLLSPCSRFTPADSQGQIGALRSEPPEVIHLSQALEAQIYASYWYVWATMRSEAAMLRISPKQHADLRNHRAGVVLAGKVVPCIETGLDADLDN